MSEQSKSARNRGFAFALLSFFALIAVGAFLLLKPNQASTPAPVELSADVHELIDNIEVGVLQPLEVSGVKPPALTDDIRAVVDHIERNIVLPREAADKKDYDRYYTIKLSSEKKEIHAVFLQKGGFAKYYSNLHANENRIHSRENAFFVAWEDLPIVMDGGCGVINLSYELTDEPLLESEKICVMSLTLRKPPEAGVKIIGYCNGVA